MASLQEELMKLRRMTKDDIDTDADPVVILISREEADAHQEIADIVREHMISTRCYDRERKALEAISEFDELIAKLPKVYN